MAEEKNQDQTEEKKIIVDDDWKNQAQAEKEKLSADAESDGGEGQTAPGGQREIPPASFPTLVSTLVTQIFMSLGGYEDPQTKKRYVDLDIAKHHIDTLNVLEEKTKGNLDDDEKKMLDNAIYETRMQYVQIAQQASQM